MILFCLFLFSYDTDQYELHPTPVMCRYAIYTECDCVNTGCIHVHLVLLKWSSLLTLICIYLINKCIRGDLVFFM